MVYHIADNIISPLGLTSEENYQAVKAGRSSLCRYDDRWGLPHPFNASLFSDQQTRSLAVEGMTRFESLAVRSVQEAVEGSGIDVASPRVVFLLSTTKANIDGLATSSSAFVSPSVAAKRIAVRLGLMTEPIVVCNACISGVSAIVLAQRLLETDRYDYAIVCGADVQSRFTISGFASLQALSETACKPFDVERTGLNLGEAAATIILGNRKPNRSTGHHWVIAKGVIRNDAFHMSSPSKHGEGAARALTAVASHLSSLAFINAHGTATLFNDQMESVAIERAGLSHVPVNGLKGYLGHTLGAAGVLETILCMKSADDHTILATRGYQEKGVSGHISIVSDHIFTSSTSFVKMISGFGGCNAALFVTKMAPPPQQLTAKSHCNTTLSKREKLAANSQQLTAKSHIKITPAGVSLDGKALVCSAEGPSLLTSLYKQFVGDYPKYYKMDPLSRLGFVASELLLRQESGHPCQDTSARAVILFNHSSSIMADRLYQESILHQENYFPSPSAFVYTLPNMVTGEIAIRHHYYGETSFYILHHRDDLLMEHIVSASFSDGDTKSVLSGWIDYEDDSHFVADLFIVER